MVKIAHRLSRPTAELALWEWGEGDGNAAVFTHGAGVDHSMFDAQAEALAARGVRVIAWDMRAHGASTLAAGARFTAQDALDDLDALLTVRGVDGAILIGHSLGGNLSQAFAAAHPERVRGLIVLDAAWNAGPLSRAERLGLRLARPLLALIPERSLPGIMARASAVTPDAIARTEELFARMPKRTFLDVWAAATSLIDPDPGFRTPVPLALVRGARDRTGNIATAMPQWAAAEGVRERVISGAGHMLTWDAPEESSRILVDILEQWGIASSAGAEG